MSEVEVAPQAGERKPLGALVVPVRFGDQVITSLLYNHDANPVHHKPDHAVQWMLGLLASPAMAGADPALAQAGPEQRTYILGAALLQRPDIVVMPGAILAAICCERFVPRELLTVSLTTTFTYPLLVPTKGSVDVRLEAWELPPHPAAGGIGHPARRLLIEAHGPSLTGAQVRLLKVEALAYPPEAGADAVYEAVVAPEFVKLHRLASEKPQYPALAHPAAISAEDRRRYLRIIGQDCGITPAAWQAKIPRVLTEIIDHLRGHQGYQAEARAYYEGRTDEAERREAIARYAAKEVKYGNLAPGAAPARIEYLEGLTQQLYARQHTVLDPRLFLPNGPATVPQTSFLLDLHLFDFRLRRGLHRFYTGARLKERTVFMGEAMVTGQPLVTKELANFLCEVNHSFETLRLFEYRR